MTEIFTRPEFTTRVAARADIVRGVVEGALKRARAEGRDPLWAMNLHLDIAAGICAALPPPARAAALADVKHGFEDRVGYAMGCRAATARAQAILDPAPDAPDGCAGGIAPDNRAALENELTVLLRAVFGPRAEAVVAGRTFDDIGATLGQMVHLVSLTERAYGVAWTGGLGTEFNTFRDFVDRVSAARAAAGGVPDTPKTGEAA